jgi:hypothetical protein
MLPWKPKPLKRADDELIENKLLRLEGAISRPPA